MDYPIPIKGTKFSDDLDLIRGISALAVFLGHLRGLFFLDYERLRHPGSVVKLLYFFTGFGHEAVIVFFVLSGLLIGNSILRARLKGTWSWANYAIDRLTRLYIVLIPALCFTALLDTLGLSFARSRAAYHLGSPDLVTFKSLIVQEHLGGAIFLGNLAFLQNLRVPTFGSDSPLWSLSNEFWYYVIFPCLLCGLMMSRNKIYRILNLACGVGAIVFAGWGIVSGFMVWLLGVGLNLSGTAANTKKYRYFRAVLMLLSVVSFCVAMAISRLHAWGRRLGETVWPEYAIGITVSFVLYSIYLSRCVQGKTFLHKYTAGLSNMSYTLYAIHFPAVLLLRFLITPYDRWSPDLPHLVLALTIAGGVFAIAFALARITENRTDEARRFLKKRIFSPTLGAQVPIERKIL